MKIGNIILVEAFNSADTEIKIDMIDVNPKLLKLINQNKEICLESVKRNGKSLQYVKDEFKTPEVCLEAVKQNGYALEYVSNQTIDICIEAIKHEKCERDVVRFINPELIDSVMKKLGVVK